MSQKRVITGSDERGRPISRWEDSEPVATGYGFMEPAFAGTIERRQATPDEMAAARARETPTETLKRASPAVTVDFARANAERMQASRMRGTERHVEVVAAAKAEKRPRLQWWTPDDIGDLKATTGAVTGEDLIRAINEAGEPPEEGDAMSTEDAGQADPVPDEEVPSGPLWALSEAARDADVAWLSLRVAELTWDVARAALAAAMAECATIMEPHPGSDPSPAAGVTEPDVPERPDHQPLPSFEEVMSEPASLSVVPAPSRTPRTHGRGVARANATVQLAQRVTEAVTRHGGDRKAAAAELGMRPNAVAMVLKHADRRAGVLA